jgi:hypothetical protein
MPSSFLGVLQSPFGLLTLLVSPCTASALEEIINYTKFWNGHLLTYLSSCMLILLKIPFSHIRIPSTLFFWNTIPTSAMEN